MCCDDVLDLSQIITSQTELQKLGIYECYGHDFGFLETFKQLRNAQLHLPVVFTLEYRYFEVEHLRRISIFPPFYDCHPTVHRILAESFDTDRDSYTTLVDARVIDGLSIYLVDCCDLPSIQVLTKNMTMTFPNITSLTFFFENPCEKIVSFLLFMIVLELNIIRVILAITGDEKYYLFIPLPACVRVLSLGRS